MAAPSYTTDLSDISLATTATGWAEPTATGWTGGAAPTVDSDYPYIEGSSTNNSVLQGATKSGIAAIMYNYGSGITVPTDGAVLVWQLCYTSTLLESYANGGLRVMIGSSLADFVWWPVGGNNAGRMPYGGWQNFAVNPTVSGTSVGSPSGTLQYIGVAINLTAGVSKGYPNIVDAVRYGRCEARMNGGETANYATFAGFAATNDALGARWGLMQAVPGGYLWKGLMVLGYSSAVDFRDSNTIIFVDDTRQVTASFNKIEIRQSGSRVDWTNITFICTNPSTTASRGKFEVINDCDVNFLTCSFSDMDTFIFGASSSVLSCTFRRCNEITAAGADMTGSIVDTPTVAADSYGVGWDVATDPDGYLDDMYFSKGSNAHHAITFGTSSPTTMTLRGLTFSGFSASNDANDSTLRFLRTSGTITVYLVGCSGTITYKKESGATVTFISDPVTITVTVQEADGTLISGARVLLKASDGTGPFPFEESVTIANSGTTATVTHTGHGMLTNDKVLIEGASHWQNNGVFQITKTNDNEYTYTLPSAPGSSPTGTITATFVAVSGTTTAGVITASRVYSADQPVIGWARKSSSAPYYKEGPLGGTIDSAADTPFTAILSPDD